MTGAGGVPALVRNAPLVMLCALAAGLLVGPHGVPAAWAAMGAAGCGCSAAIAVRERHSGAATALLLAACLMAGSAWGAARVQVIDVAPMHQSGGASGTVVVDTPPAVTTYGARAQVLVNRLSGSVAVAPGTRLLLDLPNSAPVPQVGFVIKLSGAVAPAAEASAPAWWRAYLRRQHIAGRLRAHSWTQVGVRGGPMGARDALRRWAGDNVAQGLSGDLGAIVRGMALGGGAGLTDDTAQRMRDAGLWHLLAVSGQNVAVVGIGMGALLGAAGVSRRSRLLASGAAMAAYCLACDGGASVARAGLMGAVALMADLGGRPRARWYALMLVLVVLLALDPLSAEDPGLQLSFAAVAGLFTIGPPLAVWLRGFMPGRIADLLAQSGAAGLATAPVLASGFGQISTVGLVANLVAVPVAGPVVVVALLGTVAHSVWGPAGVGLAWIAAMGAGIVMGVARVAAAIPGAVVAVPGWGVVPLALVAASPVLVWAWLRRVPQTAVGPGWGMPGRGHWMRVGRIGLTGVVVIATAGLPGWTGSGALPGGPALRVLDIGQGSAAVLRDGARADVLVDCGPPGEPPPVIDALARAGMDSVGVIIISHGALDHAGGAIAVIDAMPVGRVLLPDPDHDAPLVREVAAHAMARGVPVTWVSAGSEISIGPWSARVVGPGRDDARSAEANDRSLVVLARAPGLSALLPGDAEGNVLRDLSLPPTPVLVVSHHGSEDPAIPPVLARLRPVVAVVSSGAGNNYGHPRAQVLTALADAGAGVLRTDSGGDVDIRAGQGGIVVRRG